MNSEDENRKIRREIRRIERKREEAVRHTILYSLLGVVGLIVAAALIVWIRLVFFSAPVRPADVELDPALSVTEIFLTPNKYSRPQTSLEEVRGIVVHYTANPCSTARENRNYFEGLKNQTGAGATSASSHFVIGLEGEIVQCIPLDEIAYASNNRNADTISIECCHPDETGKFYDSTYNSLVKLCADLCKKFNLKPDAVIRHYDVTEKICPKYFVDYPKEWERFHEELADAMKRSQ